MVPYFRLWVVKCLINAGKQSHLWLTFNYAGVNAGAECRRVSGDGLYLGEDDVREE